MNSQMPRHLISDGNMDDMDVTRSRVPAAVKSDDPWLWDILAEKECDFSWSLRLNANAHLARLLPEIPMEVIKRARKTEGYKDVLIRKLRGYCSPVIEEPPVLPASTPMKSISITIGNRDSWKLIAEAEIAVEGARHVNLEIRKVLPQVRYNVLVKICKTAPYKELLGELWCLSNTAGRRSGSPDRQNVPEGGTSPVKNGLSAEGSPWRSECQTGHRTWRTVSAN